MEPSRRHWLTMPLSSAGVTINNTAFDSAWIGTPSAWVASNSTVNNGLSQATGLYYTNIQGPTQADQRFPVNIPRPGRDCTHMFSSVQFVLTQPAQQFGVFVARNANAWNYPDGPWLGEPPTPYPDDNNIRFTQTVLVAVLGESDTFATAQYQALDLDGS